MKLLVFGILQLAINTISSEKINYSGYKIVRIFPKNEEEWVALKSLEGVGAVEMNRRKENADFMMPPHLGNEFISGMQEKGISLTIVINDIQMVINSQNVNKEAVVNGSLEWDRYYRLEDIHQFLESQASIHNSIATTFSIGNSYEGREMKVIKISKSGETKPAIWIDSMIHPREWITGAVCTFIIDQILNSNDNEIEGWLDDFDFYINPVYNVDGYEFAHNSDRLWRKSRSPNGSPLGCIGTDLNRNFDYHWMENGGASPDPCSRNFGGTHVFSDIETVNVRNFLSTISTRLVFFLSIHSSGQFILFPTGLNSERIPQYNTYMKIGNLTAKAHAIKFGTIFKPGSIFDEMYVATGSSVDWVKDTLKTNLTLAYELRDKGEWGDLLPPEQIYPSGLEFMDGLKVLINELRKGIPEVDP